MIIKFTPLTAYGAQILEINPKTGEVTMRVPDGDSSCLPMWAIAKPGNTLEEFNSHNKKTTDGKYIKVSAGCKIVAKL